MREANERKSAKYDELVAEFRDLNMPLEIGCKGFSAHSVWRLQVFFFCLGSNVETSLRRTGSSNREVILLDLVEEGQKY